MEHTPITHMTPPGQFNLKQEPVLEYAGFWIRFAAHFVDGIVLLFIQILMMVAAFAIAFVASGLNFSELSGMLQSDGGETFGAIFGLSFNLMYFLVHALYYIYFTQSSMKATLGKRLLGVHVVGSDGAPVGVKMATIRYFAYFLSSITFMIGYLMAAFTSRKQALHDMIARTVVIYGYPDKD